MNASCILSILFVCINVLVFNTHGFGVLCVYLFDFHFLNFLWLGVFDNIGHLALSLGKDSIDIF